MAEIQPADPLARRHAAFAIVVVSAVGVLGLVVAERWLAGVEQLPAAEARRMLSAALLWSVAVMAGLIAILGAYAWWLGSHVKVMRRFPLPGARVVRPTPVLREEAACRRGALLQGVGIGLVALAVILWLAAIALTTRLGVSPT